MLNRPQHYYRRFQIRSGKKQRRIDAPRVGLKIIQKWFGHYLARAITMPDVVVGFVPGRSILHGAAMHCRAKWVFSTDIKDFFQSTPTAIVKNALVDIGYTEHGAEIASGLSSLNGVLAQGSPASPVLSNLAFLKVDRQLQEYCHERGLVYTRYADDIVISGAGKPSPNISSDVRGMIETGNWQLSEEKTTLLSLPNRLKVYGLLVDQARPRLTKGYRRRLRAIRHLVDSGKIDAQNDPKAYERACGHLAFAQSVEDFSDRVQKDST
ncbi:reverse transcriptase (RNA-dependent DNA polymerase) [Thiocapsa rosea]|uniref:RNA-directed DNA polymerase n=2 Tax=Thiocapsa rosea TaxID=69360 RepID=A0A495V342_9GAMM|nr:reverse transcriptase (RNA-dependent DNA polymerase) [Thiocapsa rosea]